ncbi:uncharacterized protein LOC126410369 [Nymphaea colorata]|nr:uncharacterized protein LOC126410369 [Nymphaea colorata]
MEDSTTKRRTQSDDPINDLPEAILIVHQRGGEEIPPFLLLETIRCCVRKLNLDHELAPHPDLDTWCLVTTETKSRWEGNAHQILLSHCGSIDSCRIVPPSCHATKDFSHMDSILEILIQKGARKLGFLNYGGFACPLHPCLFGYRSQEILKFRGCEFDCRFEFGSPTNLRSMALQSVKLDEETIRSV